MINNFSIFKNTNKKNPNEADYSISAKIGEKYTNIGGCWIKEGKSGKFISCQLSKPYGDKQGFQIVSIEGEPQFPTEDIINPDEIPF